MTQYAVFLYAPASDDDESNPEALAEHRQHHADLVASGSLVTAFALEDVATATSLRAEGITDGPFIESKEIILGFYVLEAPDLDAALAIAKGNPILHQGGGLEVRPVEA